MNNNMRKKSLFSFFYTPYLCAIQPDFNKNLQKFPLPLQPLHPTQQLSTK